MVTIGAAFRAPLSNYVRFQNRGKTLTNSSTEKSQGCSNVGCSIRRLSRRRFRRVSLTPTEATATAVSSPKEEERQREEREEEGVREEERCATAHARRADAAGSVARRPQQLAHSDL